MIFGRLMSGTAWRTLSPKSFPPFLLLPKVLLTPLGIPSLCFYLFVCLFVFKYIISSRWVNADTPRRATLGGSLNTSTTTLFSSRQGCDGDT